MGARYPIIKPTIEDEREDGIDVSRVIKRRVASWNESQVARNNQLIQI